MAEQAEDLVFVHLHVDSVDSFEVVLVNFVQVVHSKKRLLDLLLFHFGGEFLIALDIHAVVGLKYHGLLDGLEATIIALSTGSNLSLVRGAVFGGAPERWHEAKAGRAAATKGLWHHLLHIEAEESEPDAVEAHHDQAVSDGKVVVGRPKIFHVGTDLT